MKDFDDFFGGKNWYYQCTIGEQLIIMLAVSSVIISIILLISEKEPAFVTNMAIV
jgi:hypothetical protein